MKFLISIGIFHAVFGAALFKCHRVKSFASITQSRFRTLVAKEEKNETSSVICLCPGKHM
ncbi:hypothetical protein KP509_37G044400 [Ceratopteris richardii]|uniref:Uncharacterized protein n=1 Tax=Ceratopteris richardii TaxID=49495 RepID=A0A8T2Q9K2_CERRI|nr:hypothetical protein KP509_37G044400 [Ceratopteris richardii]